MTEWKAVAVYDFQSTNEVELELKKGDIVTIRRKSVGDGWWEGERNGVRGLIPMKFVRKMSEGVLSEEGSINSITSSEGEGGRHTFGSEVQVLGEQQNNSRPSTPRGSRRALMENLMVPETGSAFDSKKAKEIFSENSTVEISSGPSWNLSRRRKLHVVIRNPRIQQHSAFSTPHIIYEVETKELDVVVSRRYKHFLWLYDKLADLFPCISLPPLPVKQISGNVEAHFIESRRRALERFLNRVVQHPALGNSKALYEFLTHKDSKDWKIGSKSSTFSLTRNSVKRLFAPAVYSSVQFPPHNYAVSQLSSIDEFSQFAKLIDGNMSAIKQSCLDLATQNGDMAVVVHQIGKGLGRFARGEEPPSPSLSQNQKKHSSANPSHGILRSAAELEENGEPEMRDWAWQGNKSFTSLLTDVASVAKGIESVAQLCSFQQDMLEQSTVNTLQDYSGILHTVPGIVKLHEDAMKAYNVSKEKDSKKDAEMMKMYYESLNNIVLAEINYVHDQIVSDMKEMLSELLAGQVDYHRRMANRWSELHAKFTHKPTPRGVDGTDSTVSGVSAHPYMNMTFVQERKSKDPHKVSPGRKEPDYVQYDTERLRLATNGPQALSTMSSSPPPNQRQGYELLTETMGGRGLTVEQKAHSYGDIRSQGNDDVYVPFIPGQGPVDAVQRKKAADYTPFIPLSERKSDPGLLEYDAEPKKPHGYLSFVPISQQPGGLEGFLKEANKTNEKTKPADYMSFVPAQREEPSVSLSVGTEEEEESMSPMSEPRSSQGAQTTRTHSKLSPPNSQTLSPSSTPTGVTADDDSEGHPLLKASPLPPTLDTRSTSSNESTTHTVATSVMLATNDECSRHQPVAVKHSYVSDTVPLQTTVIRTNGDGCIHRKVEAGDSSASSGGESSPSPRIRSIYTDTLNGNVSWNNSNRSGESTGGGSMEGCLAHSKSTSDFTPSNTKSESSTNRTSGPHSSKTTNEKLNVADLIQRFQLQPKISVSPSPPREQELSLRRQKSAVTCQQKKPLSPSDIQRRKSVDNSSLKRRAKKGKLEVLGIIEDEEGGSFDV